MKKRIIALSLVVVMTVLSLVSCFGAYDCSETDFVGEGFASFDSAAFDAGLSSIVIKDGDFTTDKDTRNKKINQAIYSAVAKAIVDSAYDSDKLTEGDLDDHDVLYFVYFAVDENEGTEEAPNPNKGNIYFTADMKESAITASSSKATHVITLGDIDVEDEDADKFMKALKENIKYGEIKDLVYSMTETIPLAKAEDGEESTKKYDLKAGDVVYISYSRSYTKDDGTVDQSAKYEKVVIADGDALSEKLVAGETAFQLTSDQVYDYKDVKILWYVEDEGAPIATFKHTPYTSSKTVEPDNVRVTSDAKPDLKDVELTYYVYPVEYIEAPSVEELEANPASLLEKVYGSKLAVDSFDVFDDEGYTYEGTKVSDLVKKIADLYNTKSTITENGVDRANEYYAEGTELKTLADAYDKAVTEGGEKPSTTQQAAIDDAKEALTKAQNKILAEIVEKIVKAAKGEGESAELAGAAIYKEYRDDKEHELTEAYNKDIIEKVQTKVWELIESTVKINSYPEKLLKEYVDLLYNNYQYSYNNESQTSGEKLPFYEAYATLEEYIRSSDCLNVSVSKNADLNNVIETEAKTYIDPIIKIYVVAQYVNDKAVAAMPGFVQHDIDNGGYDVDKDRYIEYYGEEYGLERYEKALESIEESKASAVEEAAKFIIDDDYMKDYKKEIGKAAYRQTVDTYGEINLRASFQFNKLFYYLTSTNITRSSAGGHNHYEPAYVTRDGVDYIDFRSVTYTIEAETDADAGDSNE